MLKYPEQFPMDAMTLIVSNFRSGTVASERAAIVQAAWTILGYGLKVGIGESMPTGLMTSSQPQDIDDNECVALLESHINAPNNLMGAMPIPWGKIIKFAIKLILENA